MATLPETCEALAARLKTLIPLATYPAPAGVSGNQLWAIVHPHAGSMTPRGGSEQEWLDTLRVMLIAGRADMPSALIGMHQVIDPIADLFSADNPVFHTLNDTVDFCKLASYELDQIIEYAGINYWGGTLMFSVKRRRFGG